MDHRQLGTLLAASKGEIPADTLIRGGKIVNVFANRVEEGLTVAVKDGYIVDLYEEGKHPAPTANKGKRPKIIDAGGLFLCPGFIDAHTHTDSMVPFHELARYALKGGTTTIVTETTVVTNCCGAEGATTYMESTKGYPVRCYFTVPPMAPPWPLMETSRGLTVGLTDFGKLLKRDDVLGVGEAYWTRMVEGEERLLKQAALAMQLGKKLDGHAAGARWNRLTQFVLTGITSCHEPTTVGEVVDRLRLGLYVMIREGFVRKELPELHKIKDLDIDFRRVMLVSDTVDPVVLCSEGYMDSIARKAIGYGLKPIEAIKMVTITPADYWGFRDLGAIAPLRRADILFLRDLSSVTVEKVMTNGVVVLDGGEVQVPLKPYRFPERMLKTITTGRVTEDDFRIRVTSEGEKVRVITVENPTITREMTAWLPARDGYLEKDLGRDIVPIAVVDRNKSRNMGRGFVTGTGINDGAVAITLTWDTGNILVVGSDEKEMAFAANRIIDLQGGIVISRRGDVLCEFPMPAFGVMSLLTVEQARDLTVELEEKIQAIGSRIPRPFLCLQTIPFTGLPFLRITDKGLADIRNRKLVPLIVK